MIISGEYTKQKETTLGPLTLRRRESLDLVELSAVIATVICTGKTRTQGWSQDTSSSNLCSLILIYAWAYLHQLLNCQKLQLAFIGSHGVIGVTLQHKCRDQNWFLQSHRRKPITWFESCGIHLESVVIYTNNWEIIYLCSKELTVQNKLYNLRYIWKSHRCRCKEVIRFGVLLGITVHFQLWSLH